MLSSSRPVPAGKKILWGALSLGAVLLWLTSGGRGALDAATASKYFQEAEQLCQGEPGQLWGVSLCGPILLVDPATRTAIANRPDAGGTLKKEGTTYTGTLPPQINVANTAIDWAGTKWTMLMLPLPANKTERLSLLAHELWHRVQDQLGFPPSGAANDHLNTRQGRIWLQLEWRALAEALEAKGKERERHVTDALIFRRAREQQFPGAEDEERSMELSEGLAEYTGVVLGCGDAAIDCALENLREATRKETFVRSFAYATGPAYGLLLDRVRPDWRKSLTKERDLAMLLATTNGIELPDDIAAAAADRLMEYEGDVLRKSEEERERATEAKLGEFRRRFLEEAVLRLPLKKMSMQFDPGNLTPLEAAGTVYPNIRVSDEWGILTVKTGGALMDRNFASVTVPRPYEISASRVVGDGWTLELSPGWQVKPAAREGDLTVQEVSGIATP